MERIDDRKDYGKTRLQIIGKISDDVIVFVVCTNRGNIIRIISARRANSKERGKYYGNS